MGGLTHSVGGARLPAAPPRMIFSPFVFLFIYFADTPTNQSTKPTVAVLDHTSDPSYHLNQQCSVSTSQRVFALHSRLSGWEQIMFHAEFADVLKRHSCLMQKNATALLFHLIAPQ